MRRGPARSRTTPRAEAAAAPLVFLSVMWGDIDAALAGLPDWDGRILVDTTNQFDQVDGQYVPVDTRAAFGVETGSEVVASKAPGARVIKAFNTLFAPDVARDPRHDGGQRVLFYCGDDPDAKGAFAVVAAQAGWFQVDLGSLRDGGRDAGRRPAARAAPAHPARRAGRPGRSQCLTTATDGWPPPHAPRSRRRIQ